MVILFKMSSVDLNRIFDSRNKPNDPEYWKPENDELKRFVVNAASMEQKNTCHVNRFDQKLDTSSIEKSSPPTGDPKADDTPAAAPAEMKLRLSSGFRKRLK